LRRPPSLREHERDGVRGVGVFEGLLQPTHLVLILAIALLFFGPGRLAELGGGLGRGIREFKRGLTEDATEDAPPRPEAADPKPHPRTGGGTDPHGGSGPAG
jgi:sec-independent protein translocase protein TatA